MAAFTVPPPLEPGATVAVAAPASTVDGAYPAKYEHGLQVMEETFDLDVVEYPTARQSRETLLANPQARAADVQRAFIEDDVAALVAVLGGNDQIRILRHLDGEKFDASPPRFFGYSDNAALTSYLFDHSIVSYYGGSLLTDYASPEMHPYTEQYLRRALFEESLGTLEPAEAFSDHIPEWTDPDHLTASRPFEPHPGRKFYGTDDAVEGRVWGGCLEVLDTLLAADRHIPSIETFEDIVLALETSEELPSPAAVQRMIMAYGERGILSSVQGIMVGATLAQSHRVRRDADERVAYRESIRETIRETVRWYDQDVPIVFGVEFGHAMPRAPIPIGGRVRIDPAERTIVFP